MLSPLAINCANCSCLEFLRTGISISQRTKGANPKTRAYLNLPNSGRLTFSAGSPQHPGLISGESIGSTCGYRRSSLSFLWGILFGVFSRFYSAPFVVLSISSTTRPSLIFFSIRSLPTARRCHRTNQRRTLHAGQFLPILASASHIRAVASIHKICPQRFFPLSIRMKPVSRTVRASAVGPAGLIVFPAPEVFSPSVFAVRIFLVKAHFTNFVIVAVPHPHPRANITPPASIRSSVMIRL